MFLSTGLQAFASSDDFVNVTVNGYLANWSITNSGVNGSITDGNKNYVSYVDYTLNVTDQFITSAFPTGVESFGYFQSRDTYTLSLGISSNTNAVVKSVEYLGWNPLESSFSNYMDLSSYTVSTGGSANFANITFTRNTVRYFYGEYIVSGYNIVSSQYKFRVYFTSSDGLLGLLASSSGTRSAGAGYLAQVRYRDSTNGLMQDLINSVGVTNNLLNIDNSGVTENVNTSASQAAAAEEAADTAISSALPNADAQLDSIAAYDYNSIHTDNATAFSFWKSLGDYILSNSNLRGIGALLILCLFLGFVVFLLRL